MMGFARMALTSGVVALLPVQAALAQAYETCILHTSGRMAQFHSRVLPSAKAVVLNRTFVFQRYENINPWFLQKEPLKLGPPMRVTFREAHVEIEQGADKWKQDITFEESGWCEKDQLTGRRECYAVLANDPSLPPITWAEGNPAGTVVAHVGRVLKPDFCRAAVTGHFISAESAPAAPPPPGGDTNKAPAREPAQGERRTRR